MMRLKDVSILFNYTFQAVFVLEILVGANLQLITSVLIADYDPECMHLQHTIGPHTADTVLNHVMQDSQNQGAIDQNQSFSDIHLKNVVNFVNSIKSPYSNHYISDYFRTLNETFKQKLRYNDSQNKTKRLVVAAQN